MQISNRFNVPFALAFLAVALVALIAIVGMTFWLGERAQVYFAEVIEARDTRAAVVELRNAVQTAEASQRGFLLTGNEIYLAPYDTAKTLSLRQLEARRTDTRTLCPIQRCGSAPDDDYQRKVRRDGSHDRTQAGPARRRGDGDRQDQSRQSPER